MKHQWFSLALVAIVAVSAVSAPLVASLDRDTVGAQSVTRVNDLEVTGTTDATGVVTARAGVRLTTPTTGPIFTSGTGSPNGAVTATLGSLFLRTDTAEVYQNTDGATAWIQVGSGGSSSSDWQTVISDPLTGGSLVGWTQRTCAWTADGTGFHTTAAGTECYLSYESGGTETAPFPMRGVAMAAEVAWPAGAATTDLLGLMFHGQANTGTTSGVSKVFLRRDGALIGTNGYAALTVSVNPALGTFPTETWVPLGVVWSDGTADIYVNNVLVTSIRSFQLGGFVADRVGLWANPGRARFRNLTIQRIRSPAGF